MFGGKKRQIFTMLKLQACMTEKDIAFRASFYSNCNCKCKGFLRIKRIIAKRLNSVLIYLGDSAAPQLKLKRGPLRIVAFYLNYNDWEDILNCRWGIKMTMQTPIKFSSIRRSRRLRGARAIVSVESPVEDKVKKKQKTITEFFNHGIK